MPPFKKHPRGQFSMSANDKAAEILIYDVIGDDGWYGGITSLDFIKQLAALGDVTEITVRLNSPGGSVFEGIAIYNALKMHPATINVQIDALAASIATVIAMAGDTITISDSGMMMIHNPSGMCWGEASDMRTMADLLDKLRAGTMLGAYARTGKTVDELTAIMDAETWYTAQEAVDAGWCNSITTVPAKAATAHMRFNLSAFKHAPKAISATTDCTCLCEECVAGNCAECSDPDCICDGCECDANTTAKSKDLADKSAKMKQKETATAENSEFAIAARVRDRSLRLVDLS